MRVNTDSFLVMLATDAALLAGILVIGFAFWVILP
jgi:hypothetical protein